MDIFNEFKGACIRGNLPEVRAILSHCPQFLYETRHRSYKVIMDSLCKKQTPESIEIFTLIFKLKYASPNMNKTGDCQSVLLEACRNECLKVVRFMIQENMQRTFLNQLTLNKIFITLCKEGHVEPLQLLLEITRIGAKAVQRGFIEACRRARLNVVNLFLNLMDIKEEPPLNLPTLEDLKKARVPSPDRGSAVHCVVQSCKHLAWQRDAQHEIFKVLASRGFDMNCADSDGATALVRAAAVCDCDTVSLLLRLKCNANTAGSDAPNEAPTPLTQAIVHQKFDTIKLLVESKARIDPFHLRRRLKHIGLRHNYTNVSVEIFKYMMSHPPRGSEGEFIELQPSATFAEEFNDHVSLWYWSDAPRRNMICKHGWEYANLPNCWSFPMHMECPSEFRQKIMAIALSCEPLFQTLNTTTGFFMPWITSALYAMGGFGRVFDFDKVPLEVLRHGLFANSNISLPPTATRNEVMHRVKECQAYKSFESRHWQECFNLSAGFKPISE